MKLLIAIPALNEEASIASIIERSLAAAPNIRAATDVDSVEICVVSDGSNDRTVEIARTYEPAIRLVVFEENRGYGAAIKHAWAQSDAELLSFLDADGTCDPEFFSELCNAVLVDGADIALGCRVNADSQMPAVRRVGNWLYARLLAALAGTEVRDTASGMRVVRATTLPALMPLPDGLHFTPAMSARAHLGGDIRIIERDMSYSEREGRSKLSVVRDGVRFLRVILRTSGLYRPSRLLAGGAAILVAIAATMMVTPALHFLRHRTLEEWMIYRFIVANLLGMTATLMLCCGYLAGRVVDLLLFDGRGPSSLRRRFSCWLRGARFAFVIASLVIVGGALVLPSFIDLVRTGETNLHWSRFITMSFLYEVAAVLTVTRFLDRFLDLAAERLAYLRKQAATVTREAAAG